MACWVSPDIGTAFIKEPESANVGSNERLPNPNHRRLSKQSKGDSTTGTAYDGVLVVMGAREGCGDSRTAGRREMNYLLPWV